ncbi:MAG: DUF2812 domain-containing protein [Lachnospiraceae bacterium]|nr:DUF2812 domain-containing protein [Lachnospiraceae bacterium]
MSDLYKKFKCFLYVSEEQKWLEEMALQGYILEDIKMGVLFYFKKDAPKRMLYEYDRFFQKKQPTRDDILEKENFLQMAEETGWKEVTHDETLTYYFAKEYEEDGFNELYIDEESKQKKVDKFRTLYESQTKSLIHISAIISILLFLFLLFIPQKWFLYILSGYLSVSFLYLSYVQSFLPKFYKDLMLSRDDLEEQKKNKTIKKYRFIFTSWKLQKYLKKYAEKGWELVSMNSFSYVFQKCSQPSVHYVIDSNSMVNTRRKILGLDKVHDTKDWMSLSHDWQAMSLAYAESYGLEYLCAYENRIMIYKVYDATKIPEDLQKSKNLFISKAANFSTYMLVCGIIGFIIGFCMAAIGI